MAIPSTDPASGQMLESFEELAEQELEATLARAADAYASFRSTTFAERAWKMRRLGRELGSFGIHEFVNAETVFAAGPDKRGIAPSVANSEAGGRLARGRRDGFGERHEAPRVVDVQVLDELAIHQ